MKTGKCRRQAFIVAGEAPEACGPTEGAFDHPPSWEKHKAPFGFRELDDFETDSMGGRILRRGLTCIALIHKSQLHGLASGFLYRFTQRSDLGTVLFVGGSYFERQKMAQSVYGDMQLVTFASLCAVAAGALAAL